MTRKSGTEKAVQQAVSAVLESHVPQLKEELVHRVLQHLPQQTAAAESAGSAENGTANLLKAVSTIHAGTTQREILRALLDHTVRYSGRAALFVIKAGTASGWQGRGFGSSDEDPIKDFALDATVGLAARALQSRMPFGGKAEEIDQQFVSRFGAPSQDEIFLLPLLLKEKVAALVYADAGTEAGGQLDTAALELLVIASSAWLEVTSLRKQAQREGGAEAPPERPAAATPVPATQFSDPFAAHAPKHVVAAPARAEALAAVAEAEPVSGAAAAAAPATDPFSHMPPENAEVHRKAQRFARLLVDEIKLYNQAKVAEGRKNRDLYDRLKEDIEKSRATYHKRYGNSVASSADYLNHELVRSLAEDDSSIMGANFRR
jgi:hypothetical protein